jgi:hypothetical protein
VARHQGWSRVQPARQRAPTRPPGRSGHLTRPQYTTAVGGGQRVRGRRVAGDGGGCSRERRRPRGPLGASTSQPSPTKRDSVRVFAGDSTMIASFAIEPTPHRPWHRRLAGEPHSRAMSETLMPRRRTVPQPPAEAISCQRRGIVAPMWGDAQGDSCGVCRGSADALVRSGGGYWAVGVGHDIVYPPRDHHRPSQRTRASALPRRDRRVRHWATEGPPVANGESMCGGGEV